MILADDSNRVLMVPHYLDGKISHWYLPGGGVEFLESVEDAAVREFEEETGLRVALVEKLGYVEYRREVDPWHSITFVFRGKYISGDLRPEVSQYGDKTPVWYSADNLPQETVYYLRPLIERVLQRGRGNRA